MSNWPPESQISTVVQENYKKSVVKHWKGTPILLNNINLPIIFY